tara:strand:+ start:103 stop:708 length:606 start_codon:yes stop_codon:yes gene_type:complete
MIFFRIENKYKIELNKLDELYKFLNDNKAEVLFPKRFIKSIYFDNNLYSSYFDSLEGIVPRKKIRLRSYLNLENFNQNNIFNLEYKIHSVEGRYKTIQDKIDFNKIFKNGILDNFYGLVTPVAEVTYFREYYKLFNLRITVDVKINYQKFERSKFYLSQDQVVVEVKSNNINNLNYIDEKIFFMKTRFSKYCNALERLNII